MIWRIGMPRLMARPTWVWALFFLLVTALWPAEPEKGERLCFAPIQAGHIAEAVYPIRSATGGTVILRVGVNESGTIANIGVIHAIPSLTEEAERTVRKCEFQPAKLDGQPVDASITVAFAFIISPYVSPPWTAESQPRELSSFEPVHILSTVGAAYPANSIASGTVTLQVMVAESGAVERIDVIHGIPALTEEAEQTVRKWKFQPAMVGSRPVASSVIASFTFRVPNKSVHFTGLNHH